MHQRSLPLLLSIAALGIAVFQFCCTPAGAQQETPPIRPEAIAAAEQLIGLAFTGPERDSMIDGLGEQLAAYESLRAYTPGNETPPALAFNPLPLGFVMPVKAGNASWGLPEAVALPADPAELAFYSVAELGFLIKNRKITSVELTRLYLDRLKQYGDTLQCVITLTETLALEQARRADAEIAAGRYRGPLHGIPYGAKDLLAVPGYPTTWGAKPFENQVIDETATIIHKLEAAGAVLLAKLSMGALAWGDVWYGGTTKNPWDLKQGSSGSSAGSASATAAGLVAFAIGTETWGSIVSPSTRCGNTGLRPTYGRVSRHGAMALSWSMDKIGPICRTAQDCALVFEAIRGSDGQDQTVIDAPFVYQSQVDLSKLRFGYLKDQFEVDYPNKSRDLATLESLRKLGAKLQPVSLPDAIPTEALSIILSAEAAAAFDELTRSGQDDLLVRQVKNAWPNVFRTARFIPAVEYIQANRLRYQLIQEMHKTLQTVDVLVCPSFGGNQLLMTNLTGHPCVVMPNGFDESGHPGSITLLGNLFDEATILAVAHAYQQATAHEDRYPAW